MAMILRVMYIILADIIFGVHLLLVLVVTFGWLTESLFFLFVALIIATILSELILRSCILSVWEFSLRKKVYPGRIYDSSCIMHYGRKLFGLKPRESDSSPKTFLQKNFFLLQLSILLIFGSVFHYFMN